MSCNFALLVYNHIKKAKELLSKARAVGYKKLILWTASPLKDAIRQYEKIGFEAVEKLENTDWSMDGELIYEVRMDMELQ